MIDFSIYMQLASHIYWKSITLCMKEVKIIWKLGFKSDILLDFLKNILIKHLMFRQVMFFSSCVGAPWWRGGRMS